MPVPDRKPLELLSAWCDGSLTDHEVQALDDWIRRDPEFRSMFLLYMDQHATLATDLPIAERPLVDDFEEVARSLRLDGASALFPEFRPRIRRSRLRRVLWSCAAGLLLLTSALGWRFGFNINEVDQPQPLVSKPALEVTDDSVGVLSQVADARWEFSGMIPQVGAPLAPCRLFLKSGLAKFEFYGGATVILEGPADFELTSTSKAYCHRGKLRAQVPPEARGFTIGSPRLDLVDLGTEFGMSVGDSDQTEVHVFNGVVEIQESGKNRGPANSHRLTTGAVWRIGEPGDTTPASTEPQTFVTEDVLSARADENSRQLLRDWRAECQELQNDPDLLVYYTFDDPTLSDRILRNSARKVAGSGDGTVIGCRRVDGRWPGKGALEFRRVGDRVRLAVPGEFESLSFMAWVRIDGLDNRFASLMQTDGFEPGEPHWQIHEKGYVALGVQAPPGLTYKSYNTLPMFSRDEMGPWTHLAVVFDKSRGLVSHSVNGRTVSREPIVFQTPLRLGAAEVGNWNPAGYSDTRPIRNWNGLIDELLIFSRPLTDAEIQRHYEVGVPRS